MLRTIKREKLRDIVATQIKSFIVDENLRSGDRLPNESELALRFGVSRLSLREATKALEFIGVVEARPGRGLTVGHVNFERVTEYLGFHPCLSVIRAGELIDSRILIELGVLPHVAHRLKHDPEIIDRLTAINDQLRSAKTLSRWVELDIAFHRSLIEGSGLSPILAFGDLLAVFFQSFRESIKMSRWRQGIASHQRLIEHLRLGQLDLASAELRQHIESHRKPLRGES
jgi:DNA-binding FadR family transcriptional regulator